MTDDAVALARAERLLARIAEVEAVTHERFPAARRVVESYYRVVTGPAYRRDRDAAETRLAALEWLH